MARAKAERAKPLTQQRDELLARYTEACTYPGRLDEAAVIDALAKYLAALGISRRVVRLDAGWSLDTHPSLRRYVLSVLDDFGRRRDALDARDAQDAQDALDARAARAALDARAAQDALDAQDARAALDARDARDAQDARAALKRFAAWCIQGASWYWYRFDLSWLATTFLGAVQLKQDHVQEWAGPLFDAFVAGAWFLHFTDDTLYWVAKPRVHTEVARAGGRRRLHSADTAALGSDIEPLYFWHGVMVPALVVLRPDGITTEHIQQEENTEVRRVMIERFGAERYVRESGAQRVQADDYGELYRVPRPDDSDLVMVRCWNSTPEPDGVHREFWLRVHPDSQTAHEGLARMHGLATKHYRLSTQT